VGRLTMAALARHKRDLQLARRCAEGDATALDALVDEYYATVLNFVRRFTGKRDDAPDLVQDVFLKILRSIGGYDGGAALRTWILTIAANASRDVVRRKRRSREDVAAEPELVLLGEGADDRLDSRPEDSAGRALRAETVRTAVNQLPEVHRVAVILRYYHDLSLQEIADVCGCTIGTVGSRIHYAMKKLQRILAESPEALEVLDMVDEGGLR
jgi:RNA polymerase sigma-70 factor, ECF subfamily